MLYFDIERTCKIGALLLTLGAILCSIFAAVLMNGGSLDGMPRFGTHDMALSPKEPLSIPLDRSEVPISLPMPNIEGDLSISLDPPRPDPSLSPAMAFSVRLKNTGQIRRVTLPVRLDLRYEKGLRFSDEQGPFWVDLQQESANQVTVHVFVAAEQGDPEEMGLFSLTLEQSSIRTSHDFAEGTPFKALAEARLLGKDLFLSQYGGGDVSQRLELGKGEVISLKEGDLLSWKEGKWGKSALPDGLNPMARVASLDEKTVFFDAWGLDEYVRLSVSSSQALPFKTKGDEFLGSVRIRSEKQISCMMEKQCFVLRVGDWVLKEDNRWKILRRSEEKEAYAQGKIGGELFVFDRIDVKGGQKTVHGHLFHTGRSQMLPVDVAVSTLKKQGKGR